MGLSPQWAAAAKMFLPACNTLAPLLSFTPPPPRCLLCLGAVLLPGCGSAWLGAQSYSRAQGDSGGVRSHIQTPTVYSLHHPLQWDTFFPQYLSTFFKCHKQYKPTGSSPHTASTWYFLKVEYNRWLLAYRRIIVGMLQKHLWFAADQSSVIQFKSITAEADGSWAFWPCLVCFSGGSFSKRVLLTCWSFDLLVAFAVNVNANTSTAVVLLLKVNGLHPALKPFTWG